MASKRTKDQAPTPAGKARSNINDVASLAKVFELNTQAARELVRWTVEHIAMEKREDEILRRL